MKIFCCYARRDRPFLDKLLEQLKPLQKGGLIEIRYDADINAGSEREHSIYKHLTTAQIILLLVSPSFMASESCYKEMQQALVQHDNKAATVIPILVRPVGNWKDTLFGKLQILPTNEKPVSRWPDEDEAWCSIFEGIREVVKDLASSVQPPDPPRQASREHSSPSSSPQLQMASTQQAAPAVPPPVPPLNNRQPFPLIALLRNPRRRILFFVSVFLIIVLFLALLPGVQQIVQLTISRLTDCMPIGVGSDGIGVYPCEGELIGISDGSYALDTTEDRHGRKDKLRASEELRAGNVNRAMSFWLADQELDTNDAEPLIYLENQRVKASGRPHITFVVGVLLSTNPFDALSRDYLQAAYIAQMEYNRQPNPPGGMLVRLLLAKSGNDSKDSRQSISIAQQIVTAAKADSTIVGVMGWPTSAASPDIIRILAQAHIPMVAPGAVSDGLTGFSPYFFRVGSPNRVIAQLLVQYVATNLKARSIVVFQDTTELYSQSLAQAFKDQYSTDRYGGRLVTQKFTTGVTDLVRSVQDVLQRDNPDVLVFTSKDVNDMTTVLSTVDADAASSQVKVVMGTAAYAVVESGKPFRGYERLRFSTGAYPDEWKFFNEVRPPFFQDYTSTFDPHNKNPGTYSYSRPNALVMLGYDAMQTLFYGSKLALEAGKNRPFSPDQLQMALTQIHGSQALPGITGQISFGSDRDPINKVNFVLYVATVANRQYLKIACWQGSFFINSNPVKWRCE